MELHKFYHVKTGDVVYAVTGANNRIEALKFVSQYKKMHYGRMILSHKIIKGKIEGEDLYAEKLHTVPNGINCWIVARDNINLTI